MRLIVDIHRGSKLEVTMILMPKNAVSWRWLVRAFNFKSLGRILRKPLEIFCNWYRKSGLWARLKTQGLGQQYSWKSNFVIIKSTLALPFSSSLVNEAFWTISKYLRLVFIMARSPHLNSGLATSLWVPFKDTFKYRLDQWVQKKKTWISYPFQVRGRMLVDRMLC